MLSSREAAVTARVEELRDEMIEFLQRLVRIRTINPPGANYADCAEFIGNKYKEFGYEVRYVEAEGDPCIRRSNAAAHRQPRHLRSKTLRAPGRHRAVHRLRPRHP